ncbi:hypothetical protein [Enterococcus mundtii]|uniref:hypothetical protein n=1 Tax=Enterococcus mundtii TaxID=53346 RepID=UPI00137708E3|nr:hypothetical protein [Enterococcus mundtii]
MNILNEKRYIWFAGEKYITTFKRLSELMQQSVKSAMPEGYKFNFVQSSVSTESIYFSILSESRLFHFRISSHAKKTDADIYTFRTNNYKNFNDLSRSISEYLKGNNYLNIRFSNILILLPYLNQNFTLIQVDKSFIASASQGKMNITSNKTSRLLLALLGYGILYRDDQNDQILITRAGRSLLMKYEKFIPKDFQILQLESMRLEDLFRLAEDDKYRFEVLKIQKNELLNKLHPENAIKAHFGEANHMYSWFIPKRFRGKINAGDQVKVLNRNSTDVVIVIGIYVEDEDRIKSMKPVIKLVDKNKCNG